MGRLFKGERSFYTVGIHDTKRAKELMCNGVIPPAGYAQETYVMAIYELLVECHRELKDNLEANKANIIRWIYYVEESVDWESLINFFHEISTLNTNHNEECGNWPSYILTKSYTLMQLQFIKHTSFRKEINRDLIRLKIKQVEKDESSCTDTIQSVCVKIYGVLVEMKNMEKRPSRELMIKFYEFIKGEYTRPDESKWQSIFDEKMCLVPQGHFVKDTLSIRYDVKREVEASGFTRFLNEGYDVDNYFYNIDDIDEEVAGKYIFRHKDEINIEQYTAFFKYVFFVEKTANMIKEADARESSESKHGVENELLISDTLCCEEAKQYWDKLKEKGFVDAKYQLEEGTSRPHAAYIADYFADKLHIRTKWKVFQDLWGINNLAQEMHKIRENGKEPARAADIREIFAD